MGGSTQGLGFSGASNPKLFLTDCGLKVQWQQVTTCLMGVSVGFFRDFRFHHVGLSENKGVPYFGVLRIRILLYRVLD